MTILEALCIIVGLPVTGGIFLASSALYMSHRRKMEELKHKEQRLISSDVHAEFEKLRGEIRDLRDVSMQYDLSFDTALQQVERRLVHLEKPQYGHKAVEQPAENVIQSGRT